MYWRDVARRPGALVAIVAGLGGAAVTLGVVIYMLLHKRDISGCAAGYAMGPPLDAVFVVACLAAFAAGGLLSGAPGLTRPAPGYTAGEHRPDAGTVVQVLLVAVLLILTLLLAYETWSVSMLDDNPSPRFWPITYFVRCASRLETFATLPVATAICAFFGKWLWYRPGGAEA